MQLLVPKIRAGEVLRGTRNLRHWLRTASILHNVETFRRNGAGLLDPKLGKNLYTPQKEDSFIVAANTPLHFCVWSPRQNITLIFMNPMGKNSKEFPPYMNPGLFATWFVRTNEYNLELEKWPHFAYYMWSMVQMNALALPNQHHGLTLSRNYVNPFVFHRDLNNLEVRNHVTSLVEQASRLGKLRPAVFKAWQARKFGGDFIGFGPQVQQIGSMQASIKEYLSGHLKSLGPRGRFPGGILNDELLKALQRYKENPEVSIAAVLKNYT